MWIWRRMERVKWTDRIRNEAVLERVDEERMMLKRIRKRERNWLGHWLRRNCLLKDALEGIVNGRRVRGRRRYQMIDNFKVCGSYAETKRNAENWKDRRMLSLQSCASKPNGSWLDSRRERTFISIPKDWIFVSYYVVFLWHLCDGPALCRPQDTVGRPELDTISYDGTRGKNLCHRRITGKGTYPNCPSVIPVLALCGTNTGAGGNIGGQRCMLTSVPPGYLASELNEGDNAGEMNPRSSTESYPACARIGLRENPGKNLNQITCPDRDSNPGHLVSRPDALTVTPQVWTPEVTSAQLDIKSCCQKVKRMIPTGKEAFNRKRSIFCGPLEKELRERLVECIVCSVALYGAETGTLRRNEEKRLAAF
ncbi:hypothetical protein ANN_19560 [Periplaneta americana]|uniref:Uncharacterized protein n=1 Tax=Periplaneta americana TaxID=6978 RepID=A0ABQ8SAJ2_PERAM|nr:hypothetical protein ANN_19560 [Periplaneta americana]